MTLYGPGSVPDTASGRQFVDPTGRPLVIGQQGQTGVFWIDHYFVSPICQSTMVSRWRGAIWRDGGWERFATVWAQCVCTTGSSHRGIGSHRVLVEESQGKYGKEIMKALATHSDDNDNDNDHTNNHPIFGPTLLSRGSVLMYDYRICHRGTRNLSDTHYY
jgi:hypothetical protein